MRILSLFLLGLVGVGAAQVNPMEGTAPTTALGAGTAGMPESALDVALNRSGDGVVVWRQRLTAPPAPTYQLWAQRLRRGAPEGQPLPLAQTIELFTTRELLSVRCAVDERGNWAAVWDDADTTAGHMVVRGRRWHEASAQLGPVLLVSDGPGGDHRWLPDVAMGAYPGSPDPHWYVVWNYATAAGQSTIRTRSYRVDDSGGAPTDIPSPVEGVNSEPTGSIEGQDRPAVTVDGAGTVTYVWEKFAMWDLPVPFWRIMLRRRSGTTWLPINDPTAAGANPATGLDATDWEVSDGMEPAAASDPRTAPRVAAAADGRVAVVWNRFGGPAFGIRILEPTLPGATPGPDIAHVTQTSSAQHRRHDAAFTNEGSVLVAWEHQATLNISGNVMLSRISATGAVVEELIVNPAAGTAITSVAMAASDTGQVQVCWARGFGANLQAASRRPVDLNLLHLLPTGAPSQLAVSVPGQGSRDYQVWPLSGAGPYAATPIGDGRASDVLLTDPLLTWHLAQGGNNPLLNGAAGTLDAGGRATVDVLLPASIGPVAVSWGVLVVDTAAPWPQSLRLFTQPETIVVN